MWLIWVLLYRVYIMFKLGLYRVNIGVIRGVYLNLMQNRNPKLYTPLGGSGGLSKQVNNPQNPYSLVSLAIPILNLLTKFQ